MYLVRLSIQQTLYTAYTLPRSPLVVTSEANGLTSSDEIERFVQAVIAALLAD